MPEILVKSSQDKLIEAKTRVRDFLHIPFINARDHRSFANFASTGLQIYMEGLVAGAGVYHPEIGEELTQSIPSLELHPSFHEGREKKENYQLSGGQIVWRTPIEGSISKKLIEERFYGPIAQVGYIHPTLPRLEVARQMALTDYRDRKKTLKPGEIPGHFGSYTARYNLFTEQSELQKNHPFSQYLALILVRDIARKNAINSLRTELSNLQPYNPSFVVAPPTESVEKALAYISRKVAQPLYYLGYAESLHSFFNNLIEQQGIDDAQQDILGDIAFFRRGHLEAGALSKLLSPIMQAIGHERFDHAALYRDFLAENFKGNFPMWRREDIHGVRYPTVKNLVLDRYLEDREGLGNTPEPYQPYFQSILDDLTLKEEKAAEKEEGKIERERKSVLASKLLLESIINVSKSQFKENRRDPKFDQFGGSAMFLKYCYQITDIEKIGKSSMFVYIKKGLSGHRISGLITEHGMNHPITTVFTSLLYQGFVDKNIVLNAFNKLKEEDLVRQQDSINELLRLGLRQTFISWANNISSHSDASVKLIHHKHALLTDFIDSFEEENLLQNEFAETDLL